MPRQKKITPASAPVEETTENIPPVISPVTVNATDSEKAQASTLEIPAGHVMIVALHEDGREKAGSEFFYPERTYKRFYNDETKFRVKKKAN